MCIQPLSHVKAIAFISTAEYNIRRFVTRNGQRRTYPNTDYCVIQRLLRNTGSGRIYFFHALNSHIYHKANGCHKQGLHTHPFTSYVIRLCDYVTLSSIAKRFCQQRHIEKTCIIVHIRELLLDY